MRLLLESDKYYFLSRLVSPILVVFFFLFFYFLRMLVTTNLSSSAFYFDLLFSLNVNIFLIFTSLFFANGNVTALTLTCLTAFFNGKLPYDIKDFPHSCFQYLSLRNELEDLQSGIQRVFTEEIANVKSQSLW